MTAPFARWRESYRHPGQLPSREKLAALLPATLVTVRADVLLQLVVQAENHDADDAAVARVWAWSAELRRNRGGYNRDIADKLDALLGRDHDAPARPPASMLPDVPQYFDSPTRGNQDSGPENCLRESLPGIGTRP